MRVPWSMYEGRDDVRPVVVPVVVPVVAPVVRAAGEAVRRNGTDPVEVSR
ncbi:hypothetical protein [Streptomyces sp. ML-6]|nr:hypothetical protein [Streptomyces sp. ML-6]MDK0524419.1 hypothetical protein [Streptomyces sp. ML-6]